MMLTASEQDQLAGVAQMILRMLHHGAFQQVLAEGGALPAGNQPRPLGCCSLNNVLIVRL